MAIFDIDADPVAAVAAWRAQFSIGANGNIRYVSGDDTFHVKWINTSLQNKVWEFTSSGDDLVNLGFPNPSTAQALNTIIDLESHPGYSVNYNITDAEAEYHFGGSITQNNGDDAWGGLRVVGSVNRPTQLKIIQNNGLLTSHWGTGKNQTDNNTLLRVLVRYRSGGSDIDNRQIYVKADEWFDTFAIWNTQLGLGESIASIQTANDPQNNTDLATVQGYTGISAIEGYQLLDVDNAGGTEPYIIQWSRGGNTKTQTYEWIKSQVVAGTLFGLSGSLFKGGVTHSATVGTPTGGSFTQNEVLTWTESGIASTGILMGANSLTASAANVVYLHLNTGVAPSSGTVLNGASATVTTTADAITYNPAANHVGQFTGSWITSLGVGMNVAEVTVTDLIQALDGVTRSPPNNVPIAGVIAGLNEPHTFLARATAGVATLDEYTSVATSAGSSTLQVTTPIASDEPPSGVILIRNASNGLDPIEYTSYTGDTFTLAAPLSSAIAGGLNVGMTLLWASGNAPSNSLIYSSDFPVVGWSREGDPSNQGRPIGIAGTLTQAGFNFSLVFEAA